MIPTRFSRFLDPEGQFTKPDHFVPLGHGRRVCMGEPLVKAELFVFFVSLVQRIRWGTGEGAGVRTFRGRFSTIPGQEPDPSQYSIGITRVPDSYRVRVDDRQA